MYGMDLSNYQKQIDLRKGNYDFCIIKATEGIGYIDKSFHRYSAQLTDLNKLIGCYHFARPDLHGTEIGMKNEAYCFIETIKDAGLLGKAILVLDWETEPMDREDLLTSWLETVKEKTGVVPFIYGSKSKLNKWKDWKALKNYPIWVAQWPTVQPLLVGDKINFKEPVLNGENVWKIWQYSSTGLYPDFNGTVDLDYASMNEDEWKRLSGVTVEEESISSDMQWAVDVGLFAGYEDGTYRENEALTRGQAAALFRRFTKIIKERPHIY